MFDFAFSDEPSASARVLDVAKGILVVLRGCGADETFAELLDVSRRYALPIFALATALVAAAGGDPHLRGDNPDAADAVEQEWGSLLAAISPTATGTSV